MKNCTDKTDTTRQINTWTCIMETWHWYLLLGKVYTFLISKIVKRFVIDVRNVMSCISSDFVSEVRSAVGLLVLVYWCCVRGCRVDWCLSADYGARARLMDHPLPGCNRARTCTSLTEPHPFFATSLRRCTGDHSTTYDTLRTRRKLNNNQTQFSCLISSEKSLF